MKSCFYFGEVKHHRLKPKAHFFKYKTFMAFINLDELGSIFKGIPFWSDRRRALAYFKRSDYLRPTDISLKSIIRKHIYQQENYEHKGPIYMLTNLRMFGLCYNPVTFYYCMSEDNNTLEFVYSEITNTPWHERHQYLVDCRGAKSERFEKCFHVSPFMPMNLMYEWHFKKPSKTLSIQMDLFKNERIFRATLHLKKAPINKFYGLLFLFKYGLMNYKVFAGIYWQAFCLYLKKLTFYPNPRSQA